MKSLARNLYRRCKAFADPVHPNARITFSQFGEDLLVKHIFSMRGVLQPSYIDIGAHHPYFLSNTAIFYMNGCQGINIEANPELIEEFNRYRPEDINLNIGISDCSATMTFYIMENSTLSTFSKNEAEEMVSQGFPIREERSVQLLAISDVIDHYAGGVFPDFMSLDVEGLDMQILKSIDFEKTAPKIICVEASDYSAIGVGARRKDLISLLVDKGYFEYANTNLNAIMVRRDFWFI